MIQILLVDDEIEMLISMEKILKKRNTFSIEKETNPVTAIEKIKKNSYDLVITDLKMQPVDGMEILKTVREVSHKSKIIMITGYGTIEMGILATKKGATDFIEKPFTGRRLLEAVDSLFTESDPVTDRDQILSTGIWKYGMNYKSKKMEEVITSIERIAENNLNVLITGESGTGKELAARAIHNLSNRKVNPFVPVNCGALPEPLFESELFGHEKGAFTGATNRKPGLFEFANGGTFLLDEIAEMTLNLQSKLLRVIEEKKIRRVGGQSEIAVNVRIIAATNKNLEVMIDDQTFRQDLFYRLNTIHIEMPPLRERKEDIILLAEYFLSKFSMEQGNNPKQFSSDVKELLAEYPWPGNARELQNIVGRAFYFSTKKIIGTEDIPLPRKSTAICMDDDLLSLSYKDAKSKMFEKFELSYLTHHLKINHGNISKTAESCGIDRRTIHRLISKYKIIYKD